MAISSSKSVPETRGLPSSDSSADDTANAKHQLLWLCMKIH